MNCPKCKDQPAVMGWPVAMCVPCYLADAELSIAVNCMFEAVGAAQEWGQNRTADLYWEGVEAPDEPSIPGLEAAR